MKYDINRGQQQRDYDKIGTRTWIYTNTMGHRASTNSFFQTPIPNRIPLSYRIHSPSHSFPSVTHFYTDPANNNYPQTQTEIDDRVQRTRGTQWVGQPQSNIIQKSRFARLNKHTYYISCIPASLISLCHSFLHRPGK